MTEKGEKHDDTAEALRESEEKYKSLFESSGDASFVMSVSEEDGARFLDCNNSTLTLFGCTERGQILGKPPEDFSPARQPDGELSTEKARQLATATMAGNPQFFEWEHHRLDGTPFFVEVNLNRLDFQGEASMQAVVRDITERKRVEAALHESDVLLQALMENIPDSIYFKDKQLRFTRINKAVADLLGLADPDEAVGKDDAQFFAPEHVRRVGQQERRIIETGEPLVDFVEEDRLQDGRSRWVSTTQAPIFNTSGHVTGLVGISRDITERKRAEEALRESEERFRLLVENSPAGVMSSDADDETTYANPSICAMLQVEHQEELLDNDWRGFFTPESCEIVEREYQKRLKGIASIYEVEVVGKRGEKHSLIVSGAPLQTPDGEFQGTIATLLDITERKQAEEERRKLAAVVKHSRELVNMSTLEGEMLFLNEAGGRMLGIDPDDVEQKRITDVIPEHFMGVVQDELLPTLMKGGGWEGDLQYRNLKTGDLVDVHAMTFPINDPDTGKPLFFANVSLDITERKRAEGERLSLERQVQHAQKLESLGVLAGGIAHDFNNLLMAILGNADLALHELSPMSPARHNLEEIEKASRRAAELAKQMLAYSGKGRFVVEPIRLGELVGEMAHLLQVSISKKALIKYNFADNLPAFDGDATQVRQVVMNLITNASEALGEKSGVIALSTGAMDCDRIYLDGVNEILRAGLDEPLPEGVYTYLEVADTGCGMDAETIEKVFDPFFTTKFTGRGLGMSAVLGIVRGHQGAIKVYSEVGKGTTFKVLFPASESADSGLVAQGKDVVDEEEWHGCGTILLADDEETVCTVGTQMLEHLGFSVLAASDGREALGVFREHADEIVCVLLDLTMPHLDGEEVFREMRRLHPGVTVVLCSGYNEQDATQRFAGKGLAGFLQKPYTLTQLKEKLVEALPDPSGA